MHRSSNLSINISFPKLNIYHFLNYIHLPMCEILYYCIVTYIFLMTNDIEFFFKFFVSHLNIYLEKYIFKCFAHFLVDFCCCCCCFCFCYRVVRVLFSLGMLNPYQINDMQILSPILYVIFKLS